MLVSATCPLFPLSPPEITKASFTKAIYYSAVRTQCTAGAVYLKYVVFNSDKINLPVD